MALISKTEFARLCGISVQVLSVYIGRGKVICNEDGKVDDENEVNLDFLAHKLIKADVNILENPRAFELVNGDSNGFDEEYPEIRKSEKALKFLDTQKRKKEIEKLEIEILKKRGELVPVELVSNLFAQFSKAMINAFQDAGDNLLVSVGHKKKLSRVEVADLKHDLVTIINQANDNAIKDTKKGLSNIVDEYSEKRGKGERL